MLELMIVFAIMGILASIAIPGFQTLIFRSQQAERAPMVRAIEKAVISYYANSGNFPSPNTGCSYIYAWNNPPWPPTSTPKFFDPNLFDWRYLGFSPTTYVRYSYYAYGVICANATPWFIVYAWGDLDNNGLINSFYHYWQANGGEWEQLWEWEGGDTW